MAKRVKIGDVIEIPTSRGLAYAQYSHRKPKWGALLRVFPGFYAERPDDFGPVVEGESAFVTFFPLQAAVGRKIFEVVANLPVPERAQEFPVFRDAGFIDREGRVHDWWLWDGEKDWRPDRPIEELRHLPILAVWNDTLLIERIEQEWTPEKDPH